MVSINSELYYDIYMRIASNMDIVDLIKMSHVTTRKNIVDIQFICDIVENMSNDIYQYEELTKTIKVGLLRMRQEYSNAKADIARFMQ